MRGDVCESAWESQCIARSESGFGHRYSRIICPVRQDRITVHPKLIHPGEPHVRPRQIRRQRLRRQQGVFPQGA
ncbi:hypothetical protein F01_410147 [Burkholderia cenocepacia]|nr:hypothetical protein F01_410147 [Burkholderia cenocepacia]